MKQTVRAVAFLGGIIFALSSVFSSQEESLDLFLTRLKKALDSRDIASYLENCSAEIRDEEKNSLTGYFDADGMESIICRISGQETNAGGERLGFLQILFENSHAAILENWQLALQQTDGRWQVAGKKITSDIRNLYKISLPNERAERAARVEISHTDIRFVFDDALVFYDNIPNIETALLVIGKGRLNFSPSDSIEKHQLQLIYKKPFLEDRLQYVFIRCSDGFFGTHIKIVKSPNPLSPPVTQEEKNKAASVFSRSYPRSFTVKNSVTGLDISILPQGDEAVFDFQGKKTGSLTYIYSPFSEDEVNLFNQTREHVISLYSPQNEKESKLRRFFFSAGELYDIRHYQIDVDYSPAKSYLSAKARIHFDCLGESVEKLKFRIDPELEILRVIDAEKRELFFTMDELRKFLYVYFVKPLDRGASNWIEVYYRGKLDPLSPTSNVVTHIDDFGRFYLLKSDAKIKTFFYSHPIFWYPSPPEDDYFTSRLKIIVPPEYGCLSSGELAEKGHLNGLDEVVEIEKTGNSFFTFETRAPIKQLSFIIGKFSLIEEKDEPLPLESFDSEDLLGKNKSLLSGAAEILRHYGRWFGPYPFERLRLIQRTWPFEGGLSSAGFIVLNEMSWTNRRSSASRHNSPVDLSKWDDYFLAHEIAHQWWGQGLTIGSYKDQWLSEGLAQFAAALYLRERYGEATFASILKKFSAWTEKKSSKGPIILGARLSYQDFEAYQSLIYNKSALALNMLRELLGDEMFFRGLNDFYKRFQFKTARTANFREAMEKASGTDLGVFFNKWFFSDLLPNVNVAWFSDKNEETNKLLIKIRQEGDVFIFPLWIEWRIDKKTFRKMVVMDAAVKEYVIPVMGKPSWMRINPDHAVPGNFKILKTRQGKILSRFNESPKAETAIE